MAQEGAAPLRWGREDCLVLVPSLCVSLYAIRGTGTCLFFDSSCLMLTGDLSALSTYNVAVLATYCMQLRFVTTDNTGNDE